MLMHRFEGNKEGYEITKACNLDKMYMEKEEAKSGLQLWMVS